MSWRRPTVARAMTRNWELPGTKLICTGWASSRSYGLVNSTSGDRDFAELTAIAAKIPLLLYHRICHDPWLHLGICSDVSDLQPSQTGRIVD